MRIVIYLCTPLRKRLTGSEEGGGKALNNLWFELVFESGSGEKIFEKRFVCFD